MHRQKPMKCIPSYSPSSLIPSRSVSNTFAVSCTAYLPPISNFLFNTALQTPSLPLPLTLQSWVTCLSLNGGCFDSNMHAFSMSNLPAQGFIPRGWASLALLHPHHTSLHQVRQAFLARTQAFCHCTLLFSRESRDMVHLACPSLMGSLHLTISLVAQQIKILPTGPWLPNMDGIISSMCTMLGLISLCPSVRAHSSNLFWWTGPSWFRRFQSRFRFTRLNIVLNYLSLPGQHPVPRPRTAKQYRTCDCMLLNPVFLWRILTLLLYHQSKTSSD